MNAARAGCAAVAMSTALGAGGCALLDTQQRYWIYQPGQRSWPGAAQAAEGMQDVWITFEPAQALAPVTLHGLWLEQPDAAAPLMLYLHGVRWDVRSSARRMRAMHELGFAVLGIDYRGFGRSSDALPSEDSMHEDALAGWRWLARQQPRARRFLYGHSLGSSIAIRLASEATNENAGAAGVIVEGAFPSALDLVATTVWGWLPLGTLITQRLDAGSRIGRIDAPLLVVHGGGDTMVPSHLGRALYERAQQPKRFVLLDGARHHEIVATEHAAYRQAVAELLDMKVATK